MAQVSRRYCRWFVSPTQMSFAVLRACRAGCRSWPVWLAVAATAVTKRDWSGSCCYIVCLHHSKKTAHQCRLFLELARSTIHNPIRPDAGLNLDSHAQQASLQLPTCADNVGLLHTWTAALLVCSPTHSVETTSLRSWVNSIGCQYRDEWSSRLHVWHTSRLRQQHRRTYLPTFNSSLSMVDVISARLPTEHSLFHAHVPLSATEVLLSQDRVCGTVYRLRYKTDHQLRTV